MNKIGIIVAMEEELDADGSGRYRRAAGLPHAVLLWP